MFLVFSLKASLVACGLGEPERKKGLKYVCIGLKFVFGLRRVTMEVTWLKYLCSCGGLLC